MMKIWVYRFIFVASILLSIWLLTLIIKSQLYCFRETFSLPPVKKSLLCEDWVSNLFLMVVMLFSILVSLKLIRTNK